MRYDNQLLCGDALDTLRDMPEETVDMCRPSRLTIPEGLAQRCILAGCPESGTVLDPFVGSGTTAVTAQQLGRSYVGIDLNPAYITLAQEHIIKRRECP